MFAFLKLEPPSNHRATTEQPPSNHQAASKNPKIRGLTDNMTNMSKFVKKMKNLQNQTKITKIIKNHEDFQIINKTIKIIKNPYNFLEYQQNHYKTSKRGQKP